MRAWIIVIIAITLMVSTAARASDMKEKPMPTTNVHRMIAEHQGWLNTSRPITSDDLQGRIILLDFWTYCCINCMHIIPDLQYLEQKFGDKLTVIGIHSAKFKNEQDSENIRQAILRYDIHHLVVNDFDFSTWQRFGIRAWPTFVLISPTGMITATYSGEGNRTAIERDIEKLVTKYNDTINTQPLPVALEKDKQPTSFFSFPAKLAYAADLAGKPALFVSDSGHHRIVVMSLSGKILHIIGNGQRGFKNGAFTEAQFNAPQGMAYKDNILYVADTGNHMLRKIDFAAKTVNTLAGTGKQGNDRSLQNAPALETALASPWDVAFYPDPDHLAIAMAGTHQLWSYDIKAKTVRVIAGNGRESIDDGAYPNNSLSQPSGLSVLGDKLYFVDAETSSLRVLEKGEIKTLIGTGLFDFGYKEGKQGEALMQHPLGLYASEDGIYIADSYNHSIRRYDPATGKLFNFAGHGERGIQSGTLAKASFNEPNALLKIDGRLYIADTNNHVIRVIDPTSGEVSSINTETDAMQEFEKNLPNVESIPEQQVHSDMPIPVKLKLQPGWKINHEAPSYFSLFEIKPEGAIGLTGYELGHIEADQIFIYPIKIGQTYRLQGTLYYCETKEGSQCMIKSYDIPITPQAEGKKTIELLVN